jgi:FkbM family methyltransferase
VRSDVQIKARHCCCTINAADGQFKSIVSNSVFPVKRPLTKIRRGFRLAFSDPYLLMQKLRRILHRKVRPPRAGTKDVNGIRFEIDLTFDPVMEDMYYDLYELKVLSLLKKYLREGDMFIDVGANIGYISAFALGAVGKTGEIHAFEPAPRFFERLQTISQKNPGYHFYANNFALGDYEGTSSLCITSLPNIGWNTMVPNFMRAETIAEKIEVPVRRLDAYLFARAINKVRLIKIDTEGYELPVIRGMQRYLLKAQQLPILIIEVAPSAYPKMGCTVSSLWEFLSGFGYKAYGLDEKEMMEPTSLQSTTDVLFIPRAESSAHSHGH